MLARAPTIELPARPAEGRETVCKASEPGVCLLQELEVMRLSAALGDPRDPGRRADELEWVRQLHPRPLFPRSGRLAGLPLRAGYCIARTTAQRGAGLVLDVEPSALSIIQQRIAADLRAND